MVLRTMNTLQEGLEPPHNRLTVGCINPFASEDFYCPDKRTPDKRTPADRPELNKLKLSYFLIANEFTA